MNIISRAAASLVTRGPKRTFKIAWSYLVDSLFDIRYGTDTLWHVGIERLTDSEELRRHGIGYQPTRAAGFSRLLTQLQLPPNLGFVDLGCGKGRVLMMAAEFSFNPIRGIDMSGALCATARSNLKKFARYYPSAAHVEVHEINASDYPIQGDENLFFMFNPFDEAIIEVILNKLRKSLVEHPRVLYVIYNNPIHARVLDEANILPVRKQYRIGTSCFAVYSNRELPPESTPKLCDSVRIRDYRNTFKKNSAHSI